MITADQAQLISATRFGRVLLHDIAAAQGIDPSALRMSHQRSELAVVQAWRAAF